MKIENISLHEEAWKTIDILGKANPDIDRDLMIGGFIEAGLHMLSRDMKDMKSGMSEDEIHKRIAVEKGIEPETTKEIEEKIVKHGGFNNCYRKKV